MEVNKPKMIRGRFRDKEGQYRLIPWRLRKKFLQEVKQGIEQLNLGCNRILVHFHKYKGFGWALRVLIARIDDNLLPHDRLTGIVCPPSGLDDPEVKKIVEEAINPVCRDVLGKDYSFELSTL